MIFQPIQPCQFRPGHATALSGTARTVSALVPRDKRLLTLPLTLPKADTAWRLVARDAKLWRISQLRTISPHPKSTQFGHTEAQYVLRKRKSE